MSTIAASVTAGYTFVADAENKIQPTKDRLNLLGTPSVTVPLSDSVATADLKDNAVTAAKLEAALQKLLNSISFSVGPESSDTIDVDVQINDALGAAIANYFVVTAWLSDSAGGGLTATAPQTAFTVSSVGSQLDQPVTGKMIIGLTGSSGIIRFRVNHTNGASSRTWYLNAEVNGTVYTSDAITISI